MGNSRVSLRWVAQQAGVSPATVSRVSRGSTQVSPELRDRVLRVIEESGYRPSYLGRALAETRHGSLGLVFPGLSGPYFSGLLQGFEAEALETGDSVLLLASHYLAGTDAKVIDLMRPRRRDGDPRRDRLRRGRGSGGAAGPRRGDVRPAERLARLGQHRQRDDGRPHPASARRPRVPPTGVRRPPGGLTGCDVTLGGVPRRAPRGGRDPARTADPGRAPAVRRGDRHAAGFSTEATGPTPWSAPTTRPLWA